MCKKNFVFWFCLFFLLIAPASKSWQNSTSNQGKNDNLTVRYGLDADFTNYSNQKIHTNLTIIKDEDDSMSAYEYEDNFMFYEYFENYIEENNRSNIVPYEMCYNVTCIQFCCPFGGVLYGNNYTRETFCTPGYSNYTITHLPNVYTNDLLQSENKKVDELFQLTIYNPCLNSDYIFLRQIVIGETFMIFVNGSIYLPYSKIFVKPTSYCFIAIPDENEFEIIICSETFHEVLMFFDPPPWNENHTSLYRIHIIISWILFFAPLLFMVITFLVYSILPELRNIHGFMLRNYVGSKFIDFIIRLIPMNNAQYSVCVICVFFNYIFSLADHFWLIVMSFDMWKTFRGLCSLQRNIRQRKRNKLVFYMLFAWGLSLLFAIIYAILEVISEYLPKTLQPKFCKINEQEKEAAILYYYTPTSICVISSVCLTIFTTRNIARYEKDINHRLLSSKNKQYNDNKKWFRLCQQLFILEFIVLLLKYFVTMMTSLLNYDSVYNMYTIFTLEFVENLCTFIIYVWKKEIKLMLLKRFSCCLFKKNGTNAQSSNI